MGASGSGKTTLLNALSGRLLKSSGSILEGEIFINNKNIIEIGKKYTKMLGYVQQHDMEKNKYFLF